MLIGVYYDDPESVPEEELRFAVGVVVAQSESISIQGSLVRFLLDPGLFNSQFYDYFLCVIRSFHRSAFRPAM